MDEVVLGSTRVPAVRSRECRVPIAPRPVVIHGLRVDSLENTAVTFAAGAHPLEAFVAVCGILRKLARFDRFSLAESRKRETQIRQDLLRILSESAITHGCQRARELLTLADAACESVGERALLWVILTVSPLLPRCQHEVVIEGRRFYLDFAFPEVKLAFEFDGIGKMGSDEAQFRQAQRDMLDRQRMLERAGWTVIRFQWRDFSDFEGLRLSIAVLLTERTGLTLAVGRNLWKPVPAELNSPFRRFL